MEIINLNGLNEKIYTGVCENGLKVFVWANEKVKTTYMTLSIKYGSIHTHFKVNDKEYSVPNGIAHFLEHIKFNESANLTAHDFFNKNGAETNAFTTFKYTSYLVYSVDKISENLNHLLDFVQNSYFSNKIVQKEKGIIIEEAKMGQDNPLNVEFFGINKALFENSNYRNLITGTPEDIRLINLQDIKLVYENFYTPDNMFLCVTGNVNPYEIFEIVKQNQKNKVFKKIKNREIIPPQEKEKVNKKFEQIPANINTPIGNVGIKIPLRLFKSYEKRSIIYYLNLILMMNFDSTSDFKEELLSNNLITNLSTNTTIMDQFVILNIDFESKYPEEVTSRVKNKLKNLELSDDILKRKIKALIAYLVTRYEDVETVNSIIQSEIINYGKILQDTKDFLRKIDIEDIKRICKKININNCSTFIMLPKEK